MQNHKCFPKNRLHRVRYLMPRPNQISVHPWHVSTIAYRLLGVGKPGLEIAINTWYSDFLNNRKNYISWHQDAIFCPRMGLTEEAMEITQKKLCDAPRRFPAFWGPGHDYVPDRNWGGSGMIGLQEMLLQTDSNDQAVVLPAWPSDYDVSFKLHISHNRVVEVDYKNGKIVKERVSSYYLIQSSVVDVLQVYFQKIYLRLPFIVIFCLTHCLKVVEQVPSSTHTNDKRQSRQAHGFGLKMVFFSELRMNKVEATICKAQFRLYA